MNELAKYINKLAASCGSDRREIENAVRADLRAHNSALRDAIVREAMTSIDVHDEAKRHEVILSDGFYSIGGASREPMVSEVADGTRVFLSDGCYYSIGRNRAA
jgi:hypothetical protein